jgi:hypothetical protein
VNKMHKQRRFFSMALILSFALLVCSTGILGPAVRAQTRGKLQRVRPADPSPVDTTQEPTSSAGRVTADMIPQPDGAWVMDGTSKGRLTTSVLPPNVALAVPLNQAWTAAASTGTIDEDSLAIAEVKNFTVSLKPGLTGTVTTRLNVTSTNGASSFCPATSLMLKIRYRQSDASGTLAKVTFELHQTNISTGGNTVIVPTPLGFSSGGSFFTISGNFGVDLDFANNIYWIEIKVFRSDPAQFADFGSVQVWEAAGTACP